MKTAEDLKQEILPWVRGADRYNQNLESHLEYAANEIVKLSELYAAQQVAAERERIKELEKQIERLKFDLDFAKSLLAQYADNED